MTSTELSTVLYTLGRIHFGKLIRARRPWERVLTSERTLGFQLAWKDALDLAASDLDLLPLDVEVVEVWASESPAPPDADGL